MHPLTGCAIGARDLAPSNPTLHAALKLPPIGGRGVGVPDELVPASTAPVPAPAVSGGLPTRGGNASGY